MGLSEIFNAMGDPTRRSILAKLRQGDMSAGELANNFPLAKSTMSGHFNVLRAAGLIVKERLGTKIVYSLNVSVCEEALGATLSLFGVGDDDDDDKILQEYNSNQEEQK